MSLKVEGLRKSYKSVEALKSLDFTLERGRSIALLGPNGAGKSTAIKILVSLVKCDAGAYTYDGEDLLADTRKIRDLIGYVSQELALDKILTGAEFMRFCAGLFHMEWRKVRDHALGLLDTMGLSEAKDRKVGDYSGGMKRRLDLAAALLHDPKVLVLDEPTTGLDIEAKEQIWGLIRQFVRDGGSLILASHDFREVDELSDDVAILQKGVKIKHGSPEQLKTELGSAIIRIKTREYMQSSDQDAVRQALASWDALTSHHEEDYATFAYSGSETMPDVQAKIYQQLEAAKLPIHSVNLQKPDLEDAYRFSLGGTA